MSSPANNATFFAPASITLTANATDPEGLARVEFYQGTTLVGTATSSPYTFNWTGVAASSYSLTAKAVDTFDAVATSTAVNVVVNPNSAPTVSLTSPSNGAVFNAPANIAIAATAADADGTIAKVDFYQGTTLLGTAMTAPYSFNWANVALGSYSVTAVATDDHGATTTSAAVSITVRAAAAQMYFIEVDHLNTPRSITDQSGNEVWRWDNTEPFGDSVPNGDPNGTGNVFDFPLALSRYYRDKEMALLYSYFRDCYDPMLGRFCESDPIGLRGGVNTYLYVSGNPLSFIDVLGLAKNPPICFKVGECVDPPVDPTTSGPKPSPQPGEGPMDPRKPRGPNYNCADVEPSLGACLDCCASRSVPQYARKQGSICPEECYRRWGITRGPGSPLACAAK